MSSACLAAHSKAAIEEGEPSMPTTIRWAVSSRSSMRVSDPCSGLGDDNNGASGPMDAFSAH